ALEVLDQFLVLYAQHTARQHAIPVLHDLDVDPVAAPDVFEAVREFLAVREQLAEVAEAAVHRVAARVDDARIRQDQVDQRSVPEVVRHLVDDARLAGAIDARVVQVFFAEPAERLNVEFGQYLRITRLHLVRFAPVELVYEPRNVSQLARAFDG